MTYLLSLIIAALAAVSDVKSRRIQNRFLFICLVTGFSYRVVLLIVYGSFRQISEAALGGILPVLILIIPYAFGAFGASDIKLLSVLGVYIGPDKIISVIFIAIILGAVYGLKALLIDREHTIAFAVPVLTALSCVVIYEWTISYI